jgi:phosphopantothenoylcysteine decarboxylase/phosphopantothenate--cysteine ligase
VTLVLFRSAPVGRFAGGDEDRRETAAGGHAVGAAAEGADVVVMAAVADFRRSGRRERSSKDGIPSSSEPTPDIGRPGHPPPPGQVLVGFAAETHDAPRQGRLKLVRKGVDIGRQRGPLREQDLTTIHAVVILTPGTHEIPLTSKDAVAHAG